MRQLRQQPATEIVRAVHSSVLLRQMMMDQDTTIVSLDKQENMGGIAISEPAMPIRDVNVTVFVARSDVRTVMFSFPDWAADWLEFKDLADKWKRERKPFLSVAGDFMNDPNYGQIVAMGPPAIRFILWELVAESIRGKFNHWFPALARLSKGANPVPEQSRGKMREMAEAWIRWGVREGHIDRDCLVASGLSQSR